MNNLSLYIHIPFCVRKCHYCDFLSAPCNEETRREYVETLCTEIAQKAKRFQDRKVDTIFFGGGTPSLLSAEMFGKIMTVLRQEFQIFPEAEISVEVNPGTVDREKLEAYQKLGVNRLSIGLQSADNEELKILGRIHTWETFKKTWNLVRELGFSNVNIDLMSALPGQTLASYERTLRKVLGLKPEHISAYSLIIEEGTKFYEWFGEEEDVAQVTEEVQDSNLVDTVAAYKTKKLPDEIADRQMYEMTRDILEQYGYHRYEISNYALKGYECKHNVGYWKRKEYLGLGLGAASLVANVRSSNVSELATYLEVGQKVKKIAEECASEKDILDLKSKLTMEQREVDWIETQDSLSVNDQMEEFMFLGLRMMEGVSIAEFEKQFGKPLQEIYGKQISKLEKQGLLQFKEETGRYALTLQGIDVSNQVFVEFID